MPKKNFFILLAGLLIAAMLILEMITQIFSLQVVMLILLPLVAVIIMMALKKEPTHDDELVRMVKTHQYMYKKIKSRRAHTAHEDATLKSRQ